MEMHKDIPVMTFTDQEAWAAWLADNYDLQSGVWIKVARKDSGHVSVSRPDALDTALCYGWIDGQVNQCDEPGFFLQKYTPRRKRSLWSQVNIGKVTQLIADGKMQPPGQAEIDRAKADGRWDAAYASQKNAVMPDDFAQLLEQNPTAKVHYESLNRAEQYAFLWRLMTARTPEARARQLETGMATLREGQRY